MCLFSENLTSLIEAASDNNVQFVYAISPGLDISFSSAKDVQFLKRKLEQVSFGIIFYPLKRQSQQKSSALLLKCLRSLYGKQC